MIIWRIGAKTKRPPGNVGGLLFSRENSSNGGENPVKTFLRNLMSRKTGVSSNFSEINAFVFNNLHNQSISEASVPI
jgi:hypothetical protein